MPDWQAIRLVHSVADVEFIGIELMRPSGAAVYYRDEDGELIKEIGDLLDPRDGRLLIFPRRDITLRERAVLLGFASKKYTEKRSGPGWETYTYKGQRRHRSQIVMPANPGEDSTAHAIVSLEHPQKRDRFAARARDAAINEQLELHGGTNA